MEPKAIGELFYSPSKDIPNIMAQQQTRKSNLTTPKIFRQHQAKVLSTVTETGATQAQVFAHVVAALRSPKLPSRRKAAILLEAAAVIRAGRLRKA